MAQRQAEPEDSLGLRLLILRTKHRWSLRDVTGLTGIPPSNLSSYERNKIVPPTERLIVLSRLYGVTTDYILFGDMGRYLSPDDGRLPLVA